MLDDKTLYKDAMRVLKKTSRTFYIPITLLESTLKQTVASAYLCMRAIDEIEDDEHMPGETKQYLLWETSKLLGQDTFDRNAYKKLMAPYENDLPEVTLRLDEWLSVCPEGITRRVKDAANEMAVGMADWVEKKWQVQSKKDLDDYTYHVAGLVGVMLSDIWEWHDGTKTDRALAIGYGRGLQAVNILRNQEEDLERGVKFFPDGWSRDDMFGYAKQNLALADQYMEHIKTRSILLFCKIPLALAKRTLKAMQRGEEKMSRKEVEETVEKIVNE